MRRVRLAVIALGVVVFAGLVAALALGEEERVPAAARAEAAHREAAAPRLRGDVRGGAASPDASEEGPVDRREVREELARQQARFTGSAAPRLGDRLDPASAGLDEPADPRAKQPQVVVPTTGEGAEADDWDRLSPEARVARARREVESALAEAARARDDEEREQWQARASQALSAVRADFYATGDEAGYGELEARIEP